MVTHDGFLMFTCPYCSKTWDSVTRRERHINLQPYCCARRRRELDGYVSAHMKKKKRRERSTEPVIDTSETPSSKRSRDDLAGEGKGEGEDGGGVEGEGEDGPPAKRFRGGEAGAAECEPTLPPNPASVEQPIHIKYFPTPTAGAPISSEKQTTFTKEDLREYLGTCGRMGEPKKFDIAELYMTTKLDDEGRTRHLKSNLVSSFACKSKIQLTNYY